MSKRAPWPMKVAEGTKHVGTATVRGDALPKMTAAQRDIYKATGRLPEVNHAFDEIADGYDPFAPLPLAQHPATVGATAKKPKYRNTKCEHDGIKFDSLRERARWFHLILKLQVPFVIAPPEVVAGKKRRARTYVADFVYKTPGGKTVVEDVKGMHTPMYLFKRHLMKTIHNIDIVEIK